MALPTFSEEELKKCQRWFKYILIPFSRSSDTNSGYLANSWERGDVSRSCARIMDVIRNRIFDMQEGGETDKAFDYLSKVTFIINPADRYADNNSYKISVSLMTKFLAYICLTNHIFWDENGHSEYEVNYFQKTKLGKALKDATCFVSQQNAILQKEIAAAETPINTTPDTPKRASSGGSASGKITRTISINNCGGLVSTTKEVPGVAKMIFIQGEWITPKATTPRVFVTPNVASQKTLKVNVSSGQGFDDCVLYFADIDKANAFMEQCRGINANKVQNLTIRKQTTDQNGYFRVNTDFGEAFIKAARLGE